MAEDDKPEAEDNAQTIRPNRSPGHHSIPLAQSPASDIPPIVEDYSDLAIEEDEQLLQEKVADFKVCRYHSSREYLINHVPDEEQCPTRSFPSRRHKNHRSI